LWISMYLGDATPLKRFSSGLMIGLAIFEKLVGLVLLGPLLLMLSGRKVGKRDLTATVAGIFLGTFPLAYANYSSYKHHAGLVSLSPVEPFPPFRLRSVWEFNTQFLGLGHGDRAAFQVLGTLWHPLLSEAEAILLVTALVIICIMVLRQRHSKPMVLAGSLAAAYLVVGILLFLFPHETDFHHWIQATPFQYAAIAL